MRVARLRTHAACSSPCNLVVICRLAATAITFGLGTWQVFRKRDKEALIAHVNERTRAPVLALPSALRFDDAELVALANDLEYRRVQVRGRFLGHASRHALRVAPRQCAGENGFQLVQAFERADDGSVLLVNRGWLPATLLHDADALAREVDALDAQRGTVTVTGFVRRSDRPGRFVPANNVRANRWYSINIAQMADAVGHDLDVVMDGGIRRGSDVVKAVALGARAVMIGRAYLWGLAANGQAGVENVLDVLRGGIDSALMGLGVSSIDELTPDHVLVPASFHRALGTEATDAANP